MSVLCVCCLFVCCVCLFVLFCFCCFTVLCSGKRAREHIQQRFCYCKPHNQTNKHTNNNTNKTVSQTEKQTNKTKTNKQTTKHKQSISVYQLIFSLMFLFYGKRLYDRVNRLGHSKQCVLLVFCCLFLCFVSSFVLCSNCVCVYTHAKQQTNNKQCVNHVERFAENPGVDPRNRVLFCAASRY